METALITFITLLIFIMSYCLIQIVRNNEIHEIRKEWIYQDDKRWYKYTYQEMFTPSKSNWYGLRYPKDEHYENS